MDIILIGRVAETWALEEVNSRREELARTYSTRYLLKGIRTLTAEFADDICMRELTRAECDVFIVGQQGITKALWALGETLSCGLRVRLEDIPISQFVIEMAELADENPYQLNSLGCILACCGDGTALTSKLREDGYEAAVIGFTTTDNIRGIINHDALTYLTP